MGFSFAKKGPVETNQLPYHFQNYFLLCDQDESYKKNHYPFDLYDYSKGEKDIKDSDRIHPRHDLRPKCTTNFRRLNNKTSSKLDNKKQPILYCRGDYKYTDDQIKNIEHPEVIYFGIEFHRENQNRWKTTNVKEVDYSITYHENSNKYMWTDSNNITLAESEDLWWGWEGICAGIQQISEFENFTEICHQNHETFPMTNPTRVRKQCPTICLTTPSKHVLVKNGSEIQYTGEDEMTSMPLTLGKYKFGFYYKEGNWTKFTTLLPAAQCPNDAQLVIWLQQNGKPYRTVPEFHLCDVGKSLVYDTSFLKTHSSRMQNECLTSTSNTLGSR